MVRTFLACTAVFIFTFQAAFAEQPTGPFARGEKLPGDLSDLLDSDHDGVVTDGEAQKAVGEFGEEANEPDISDRGKAILAAFDRNKDGKLDQDEAQEGVAKERIKAGGAGQKVAQIFNKLDVDRNQFVTQQEFGALVRQLGPIGMLLAPKLVELFQKLDANRDRAISVPESQLAADFFAAQARLKEALGGNRAHDGAPAGPSNKIATLAKQTILRLDADNDNHISVRESKRDRKVWAAFQEVDTDTDHLLSYEEVLAYLSEQLKGHPDFQ